MYLVSVDGEGAGEEGRGEGEAAADPAVVEGPRRGQRDAVLLVHVHVLRHEHPLPHLTYSTVQGRRKGRKERRGKERECEAKKGKGREGRGGSWLHLTG